MKVLLVILLAACAFVAAILNLALNARAKGRVMGVSACFAVVVGLSAYGYAYAVAEGVSIATVLRTLLTVCRMFGGVNDFGALSRTPLCDSRVAVALFWLAHFLAFYVTASAAIAVLGKKLLAYARLRLLRLGRLTLVYGATSETARLVSAPRGGRGLVFVSENGGDIADIADSMGGLLFTDDAALCASPAFLKRLGVFGDRALSVYCVSPDGVENLRYASALREALKQRGADGARVSLFLLGVAESKAVALLSGEGRCGYGSVFACDRCELTARLALRRLPPWERVAFDPDGRAAGDLRVLIVGFGPMGQAMLKQLVMNGQFEGSAFRAEVIDPNMDALSGLIRTRFRPMLEAYDIRLIQSDARGAAFYRRLEADAPGIIALCAGSRRENATLNRELERFYELRERRPAILQCAEDGVVLEDKLYRLEQIDVSAMDRLAMVLNHVYCRGASPEADWRTCDAFSRASCRASVDFYPAYLHILGARDRAALQACWPPEGALLENLARTEHLRWCAFHLAMGYRPMSPEEFDARAARLQSGERLRPGKDAQAMAHACLVPWEALDALSARESALTGKKLDYKQMDVDNILAIPEIMRLEAALEK